MASDDVPEWALRKARGILYTNSKAAHVVPVPLVDLVSIDIARALTEAEQRGHERGVREERERAAMHADAVAKQNETLAHGQPWDTVKHLERASCAHAIANALREGVTDATEDPDTPGDTEGGGDG